MATLEQRHANLVGGEPDEGESGSSFKEQGVDALRFYTRTKTVAVRYSP